MFAHQPSQQALFSPQTTLGMAPSATWGMSAALPADTPTKELVESLLHEPAPEMRFSIEWAAGFVDGEACLHVAKQSYKCGRNVTYRLRVSIMQNNLEVLEHFKAGMGIPANLNKIKRTPQHNRQVYNLNYDGAHAMALIAVLRPHLVRKRPEADAAFTFWVEGQLDKRFGAKSLPDDVVAARHRLYLKLRSLK